MRKVNNPVLATAALVFACGAHSQAPTAQIALDTFRAANKAERSRITKYVTARAVRDEAAFLLFMRQYAEALCSLRDGPSRDGEWALANSDYQILEAKSVVDPVKAELLGHVLIDCESPSLVVSGGVDTALIEKERPDSPPSVVGTVTVEEPTECRPLRDRRPSLCDYTAAHVQGCEVRRRTTCDPNPQLDPGGAVSVGEIVR